MEDNKPKFNFWQILQKYTNQEKKDLSNPFAFDGTLDKSFFTNPRKFTGVEGDIIPDSEWEKTPPYDFGNPDNPYNPANRYTLKEPLQERGDVDFKNMRLLSRDKRLLPKKDALSESESNTFQNTSNSLQMLGEDPFGINSLDISLPEESGQEYAQKQQQFEQNFSSEGAPLKQQDDLRVAYQKTLSDNSASSENFDSDKTTTSRPSLNEMIVFDAKKLAGLMTSQNPTDSSSVAKAMSKNDVGGTASSIIENNLQVMQDQITTTGQGQVPIGQGSTTNPVQNQTPVVQNQSETQSTQKVAPYSTNTQVWLENLGIVDNPTIEKPSATLNEETLIKETETSIKGTEPPEKTPFSEKFDNSTFGKHNALWNTGLDGLNQASDLILGEKRGYDGKYGNLTRGLDATYDAVEDFAGNFGAIGKTVQLAMKANKLLGGIANKVGAGTDGLTATDAVLNSSFLALTPFGLANGIGSPTTDTFRKNNEAFAQVGQGFGGIDDLTSDVSNYAGKKVGNFSMGAYNDFQSYIRYAKELQRNMEGIAQNTQDKQDILNYMSPMIGSRYEFETSGGLNPGVVHRGKEGMVLRPMDQLINYAKKVNPRWVQRLSEPRMTIKIKDLNGKDVEYSHSLKWATDGEDNAIVYPEIQEINGELRHLGKSAYREALRSGNYLMMSPEEAEVFTTYYKEYWPEYFNSISNTKIKPIIPEVVPTRISSAIPEYVKQVINPISPNYEEEIIEFKQGGSFNIIPDGALHANLHHMDNMDITRKGIPVVSIGEDGNLEQQAEIEREEVIFRLEVTKKLEALMKDYEADYFTQEEKDWFAIQAGKLLVYELLENTVDNTGILK